MPRLPLLAALVLAATPAFGQDVSLKNVEKLQFEQTDVREGLRHLFRLVGVSYTIAPEVQGKVTVSLHNVSFETALQNVIRQVDATYRIEGGVYQIVIGEIPTDPEPWLEEHGQLDQAYVRLSDLLLKGQNTNKWLDRKFVLYASSGRPLERKIAFKAFADTERGYLRTTSIREVEPPLGRENPSLDQYANVFVDYAKTPGTRPDVRYVDTWYRPVKGSWRLLARRTQ